MREGASERSTREAAVTIELDLDGAGSSDIATGLAMYDHLLDQFAFHSGCDLTVRARSLDSIVHHVVEDVALTLGQAVSRALGDRRGIARYGCATIPMDDALARAAVDLGGRAYARTDLVLTVESVEGLPAILIPHVFRSFSTTAGATLHVDVLHGADPHHCVEAAFKAFARACRSAWQLAGSPDAVASTKGML